MDEHVKFRGRHTCARTRNESLLSRTIPQQALEPGTAAIGVQTARLYLLRKSEIRDFDGRIVVDIGKQNIFRLHKQVQQHVFPPPSQVTKMSFVSNLQITMYDVLAVAVSDGAKQNARQIACLHLRVRFLRG